MKTKRYKSEDLVTMLRQANVLIAPHQNVADAIPALSVTEVTYYRYRPDS